MSLASWFGRSGPDAAIEIRPGEVSVAALGSRGAEPVLQAFASAPLPEGAVVPSPIVSNIADPAPIAEALRAACERAGIRPRRAALVIPDIAARVSLLHFDQLPARREDLEQLVRWQIRKSLPFSADDAVVTHSPGARQGSGGEVVVVAARRATVAEYEGACDAAGIHAGVVDLSTFSLLNLYLAGDSAPAGDWLVVHMRPEYTSLALLRNRDLIFFRSRPDGDAESLSDVVHQTAMYYEDRLAGSGFTRVLVGGVGAPGTIEQMRREIATRVGRTVDPIDATSIVTLKERASAAGGQGAALATLAGMLLRSRDGAVAA